MAGEGATVTSLVTSSTSGQQQGKASMSSRISGKQEEDTQRRTPQPVQKAWESGVNPITQRASVGSQANGSMSRPGNKTSAHEMAGNTDSTCNDRHVAVLTQAMGHHCAFSTKDGSIFMGVPAGMKSRQSETLVVFHLVRAGTQGDFEQLPQKVPTEAQYVGHGPQHTMVFATSQLNRLVVPESAAAAAVAARGQGARTFKTDTEISGNASMRERKLERWQGPSDSLPTFTGSDNIKEWDQFKANEKFGVKSTYHEEMYTTRLDKSSPSYAQRLDNASRIAAEIERDQRSNAFSEQRGLNDEGYDEEDLYSGVRRETTPLQSGQPNRYVPPSRRPQQTASKSTPKQLAADPAILDAQISRKSTASDNEQVQASEAGQAETAQAAEPSIDAAKAATGFVPPSSTAKPSAPAAVQTNAAATNIGSVHMAFKNFANIEKMKVQNNHRMKVQQDKAVKVNDLKKFAKNFKLHTPVPKDLLPILAKDEDKQNEIVKKAQDEADKAHQMTQKAAPDSTPAQKRPSDTAPSGAQPKPQAPATPASAANLSQRLQDSRRMHKINNQNASPVPQPPPVNENRSTRQPSFNGSVTGMGTPAAGSSATPMGGMTSPTKMPSRGPSAASAARLNVQALEFKPSAMATPFKPASSVSGTTNVASPGTTRASTRTVTPQQPIIPAIPPPIFLREAKARDAKGTPRKPIIWQLENAKVIKPYHDEEKVPAAGAAAGSAPKEAGPVKLKRPYYHLVHWMGPTSNQENQNQWPSHKEIYERNLRARQPHFATSPNHVHRGPNMAYPMHSAAPNMPQLPMAQQIPPQMGGQHHQYHHGGHFDEHSMRPSPSVQPGFPAPSPRMQQAYPAPMPHGPQMGYPQPGYMAPGAHGMPPRQYSNGPAGMHTPHMQPPMMMHQGSTGPYMQQPMMPMQPGVSYPGPQPMYGGPPQPNGFPSPGRAAPAMMPSNSHQGHAPVYTPNGQYAQPAYHHPPGPMMHRGSFNNQHQYPQSPYQQHQYPTRTPSHGYAQPHQQPHMMPAQAPPAQSTVTSGEDAK